jgi:hypothetical protein
MGAWGTGTFENDVACDFAADIAESGDPASLEKTLDRVLAVQGDYLEVPDAEQALAATTGATIRCRAGWHGCARQGRHNIEEFIAQFGQVCLTLVYRTPERKLDES